jgi:polar amino acid transport system substrate-binding protein
MYRKILVVLEDMACALHSSKEGFLMKLSAVLLLLVAITAPVTWAESLPLATGEWAPYSSEALEGYGFITEIVTEVFKEMSIEPRYAFQTWKRCYSLVVRGDVWAAFPYSYTEERAKEVLFSDTLGESTTRFFYYGQDTSYTYSTLDDLKPYKIACVKGYFYEEAFTQAGLNVSYTADEASALKRLAAGRVDLMPLNELVGWGLIKELFPGEVDQFGTLETPYDTSELKLIVSKIYPDAQNYLQRFNAALQQVKTGDAYQHILEKYGLVQKKE